MKNSELQVCDKVIRGYGAHGECEHTVTEMNGELVILDDCGFWLCMDDFTLDCYDSVFRNGKKIHPVQE